MQMLKITKNLRAKFLFMMIPAVQLVSAPASALTFVQEQAPSHILKWLRPAKRAEAVKSLGSGQSLRSESRITSDPAAPGDKMSATIAVSLGYQICDPSTATMPPLDQALSMCDAMQPELQNMTVDLTPVKTSDPSWKMYSGTLIYERKFQKIRAQAELLVSIAMGGGKKYLFIEGRIGDDIEVKKIYFQVTAENDSSTLNTTSYYGLPFSYTYQGDNFEFVPWLTVGPPTP